MIRYINHIFTASPERTWSNQEMLPHYEKAIEALSLSDAELDNLLASVRYFLVGKRSRNTIQDWMELDHFSTRATAYEENAEKLLDQLATQILSQTDGKNIRIDALLTTTATGNLMPGLSYRIARKLKNLVDSECLLLDLGNVGCTGGIKALNLAHHLDNEFHNILIISIEIPSTLINLKSEQVDIWQGNCTFGDGAAALLISDHPEYGEQSLKIEKIHYVQQAAQGLNLIRWGYSNYYTFNVEDEKTFNQNVRTYITQALNDNLLSWKDNPHWAIHPAGIALLMRLSRKLGIGRDAMRPTTVHYGKYSNMSSAGILHIIRSIQEDIAKDEVINLITMGAGFNVIYGCLRKVV